MIHAEGHEEILCWWLGRAIALGEEYNRRHASVLFRRKACLQLSVARSHRPCQSHHNSHLPSEMASPLRIFSAGCSMWPVFLILMA